MRREISRCWRKYEASNNDLAHLAANTLLVLATAFDCKLIAGRVSQVDESGGRGRGVRGRWRNWRNNSQVRGELWRSSLQMLPLGVRLEWQPPRHTSHVCPRCGSPANTSTGPWPTAPINDWGAWLCCSYPPASGTAPEIMLLPQYRPPGRSLDSSCTRTSGVNHPQITDPSVQPVSYMGTWAALRLPPLSLRGPPDALRTNLLQWVEIISFASFVVCHAHYTSLVWLRRTEVRDNCTS